MAIPNAQQFIKRAVDTLLDPEDRRIAQEIQDILNANREQYPDSPHHGFTYNGGFYDQTNLGIGKRVRVNLHISLWDRMEEAVRIKDQIGADRRLIGQMMGPLIMSCYSTQDVRDALPNCLTDQLDELKDLPRTRPEAYTLSDKPLLMKQFEKLKDRIHFYIALRLML